MACKLTLEWTSLEEKEVWTSNPFHGGDPHYIEYAADPNKASTCHGECITPKDPDRIAKRGEKRVPSGENGLGKLMPPSPARVDNL